MTWTHQYALRSKRRASGQSIRQIAQEIGISFSTLARVERGEGEPSFHVRLLLERWLFPAREPLVCPCTRCTRGPSLLERVVALEASVERLEDAVGASRAQTWRANAH